MRTGADCRQPARAGGVADTFSRGPSAGIDIPPDLSIILPVFNEERRLPGALQDLFGFLDGSTLAWEVIVVDDGSRDRTADVVRSWQKRRPALRLLQLAENQGKGAAVQHGMLAAHGRFRLFLDADGSIPMREFDSFLPHLNDQAPVVIGDRRPSPDASLHRRPPLRRILGGGYRLLCRMLIDWEIRDYTCGFKCFSAEAASVIFSRQRVRRWAFDAEILFLAGRLSYPIVQVPVRWGHDPDSRVRLSRDVAASLAELVGIRLNALRGLYGPAVTPTRLPGNG